MQYKLQKVLKSSLFGSYNLLFVGNITSKIDAPAPLAFVDALVIRHFWVKLRQTVKHVVLESDEFPGVDIGAAPRQQSNGLTMKYLFI